MNIINEEINKKKKQGSKKILFCGNCGKNGHIYKNCTEPITSYGIIDIKIDDIANNDLDYLEKKVNSSTIIPETHGVHNNKNINKFIYYKNKIKFLLIRRKHTLGYIEFVRGHYKIENIDGIIYLFKQMIKEEIENIGKYTFDELWKSLWGKNVSYRDNEFKQSKEKFNKLKNGASDFLNLDFYVNNVKPQWKTAEWGFPKGRRNFQETDMECATREFTEETGLTKPNKIAYNLAPLSEIFIGTNGVRYKHVYYLCFFNTNVNINNVQSDEIGDIGWYSYNDTINKIRPYHTKRIKIITKLYLYIMNILVDKN